MASDTLMLMRLYWRLDLRQTGERPLLRYGRLALVAIGAITLAIFSGFAGYGMGLLVTTPEIPIELNPGFLPGALLTLVLLGVLVSGLNQALRALYLSGDVEQLVVAPIETRSVMLAKLLSRLPWNVLFLFLIAGPALATYGVGIGAGPGYFVAGAVLLLLAPLFGLSIGALMAMFLVRWLPAKRLGELLAAAYALFGIFMALLFQLPRFLVDSNGPDEQVVVPLSEIANTLNSAPVPTLWAGEGLVDIGQGRVGLGLSRMFVYILLTLGLFITTIFVADKLYLTGWLRMQGASTTRRSLAEDRGRLGGGSLQTSVAIKDWLLRIRDPRQLVSLLGGAVIAIVVSGLALFRGSGDAPSLLEASQTGATELPAQFGILGTIFSPGVVMSAAVLFVGWVIFSQLALTSLALERQSYAVLKAAPIQGRDVWRAKTIGVFIPYAILVSLLLALAWYAVGFSLAWSLYAWLCLLILGAGLLATNASVGFRYADLDWTDPRRMTTGGGGFYGLVLAAIYLIGAGLVAMIFYAIGATRSSMGLSILFAAAGILVVAGGTWLWTLWQGRWAEKTWLRLGEA